MEPVVVDPPSNEHYDATPIFNTSTGECYGGAQPNTTVGQYKNNSTGTCLDAPSSGTTLKVAACTGSDAQQFTFHGAFLVINNMCAGISGSAIVLQTCTGGPTQQWSINPDGTISDIQTGKKCFRASGTTLTAGSCSGTQARWTFTAAGNPSGRRVTPSSVSVAPGCFDDRHRHRHGRRHAVRERRARGRHRVLRPGVGAGRRHLDRHGRGRRERRPRLGDGHHHRRHENRFAGRHRDRRRRHRNPALPGQDGDGVVDGVHVLRGGQGLRRQPDQHPLGVSKEGSASEWLRVDLGATKQVSHVKLTWEAAYGKAYSIQTSADGTTWTTIYSTTTGNGATDDLTGLAGSGRYVRMNGVTRGTSYGYSLYEMQVYGTA